MAAEITTEPVKISPYTIGTGVPARDVFWVPEKLKDILGSPSLEKSGSSGKGKSIPLTPPNTITAPTADNAVPIVVPIPVPAAAPKALVVPE